MRDDGRSTVDPVLWFLAPIAVVLLLYLASYFLVVRPGVSVWFAPTGKKILSLPDYRGLPAKLFAPVHYLDRNLLRPRLWGSSGRSWSLQPLPNVATNFASSPAGQPSK